MRHTRVIVNEKHDKHSKKALMESLGPGDILSIRENGVTTRWLILDERRGRYITGLNLDSFAKHRIDMTQKRYTRGRVIKTEVE